VISFKIIVIGIGVLGLVAVLGYPYLAKARRSPMSRVGIGRNDVKKTGQRENEAAARRKQVADSLKELENRAQNRAPLELKLEQAGLSITKNTFIVLSCASAAVLGLGSFAVLGPLYGLGGLLLGGIGLPNWMLASMRGKRIKAFVANFPTAIEVIIRGVKSGLPLGACLQTVAAQAQEPVRSEFQLIVASTTLGLTIAEAIERMAQRVPLPETSFFAIVVNIQQKSGGNLTEALGNLTQVLRDRMTMELKVKALSSEARSSAWIIGMLPFVISGMIYYIQPDYLRPLWMTETGQMVLSGIGVWMITGALVMRQMVNFKP
jgi:tight adherence protein B